MSNPESSRAAVFAEAHAPARNTFLNGGSSLWVIAVACVASLCIFFRQFLLSHFNLIAGNIGDDRFIIAILEHWRAVAQGQASFRSPNFFWPEQGVLGYSEALFLFSLPYIIAREIGFDSYIAFEIALILFKAIGFISMFWLLRSFVGVRFLPALAGSVLFTLSNLYFMSLAIGHGHLTVVVFLPLLACLCCAACRAYGDNEKAAGYLYAGSFGLLLALLFFTSFYIAWFAILAGGIAVAWALLAGVLWRRSESPARPWLSEAARRTPILVTAAMIFLVGMIPFVMTYLPTLRQTGGRSFQENLVYMEHPIDVINTGLGNWMWGRSLANIMLGLSHRPMIPNETEVGWPPFTLAVVVAGFLLSWRQWRGPGASGPAEKRLLLLTAVLSASFFTCWILSLDFGGWSLWWFVFKFVPGGSAIRVPARFNIVFNIFAVVVASIVLNEIKKRDSRLGQIAFWTAIALLISEQINTAPSHLIARDSEHVIFSRVHRPPSTCNSFFLKVPATPDRPFFANQIDAMLIARRDNLPTVNGYSGWLPPDWDFLGFGPDYLQQVKRWARSKNVTAGLCALDLRDGSWNREDFGRVPLQGSNIDFHLGGNASMYETVGWSSAEKGGTWSIGERSVLSVPLSKPPQTDLLLMLTAHAFTPPQRPRLNEKLQVNGRVLAEWSITDRQSTVTEQVRLPLDILRSGSLQIEFLNKDPRSPAEFNLSTDNRKLGLALETIRLEPSPALNSPLNSDGVDLHPVAGPLRTVNLSR